MMKKFVYENKLMALCYGCGACEQVCAHDAIRMTENDEGFLYPFIVKDQCTECQLCINVCPTQDINKKRVLHKVKNEVFAAWNKSLEDRLKSTSGGIFYTHAKQFMEEGGIVYGCSMNDSLLAEHIRVTNVEGLKKLRGSKYMQSDTNDTFKLVKRDLLNGEKVLYSGTPCQIAGLRLFLHKEYANLLTIDLVCHGTPSPQLFTAHIREIEICEQSRVKEFQFRDKKKTGWRAYVSYILENGKKVYSAVSLDFYFHGFQKGYFNRESCYLCEYSCPERVGDITVSDFWGAEQIHKELKRERKYGYNLVICNTVGGERLFNKIRDEIVALPSTLDVAKQGDVRLRHAEARPALREDMYIQLKEKGYHYLSEKYRYKPNLVQRIIPEYMKNIIKEITTYKKWR